MMNPLNWFGNLTLTGLLLCLVVCAACSCGRERDPAGKRTQRLDKGVVKLEMGGVQVSLEVAATNNKRALGLMKRSRLAKNHGMIFIYSEPQIMSFYMRDTWIPLSIAFVKTDGTIINIEEMRPNTESPSYLSKGFCRFAIEMNQGWFKEHGIKAGERLSLTPEILAFEAERGSD